MGAAPGAQPGTTRQIQPSAQLPHRQLEMDRAVRAQGRRGQFAASDVIGDRRAVDGKALRQRGFGKAFGGVHSSQGSQSEFRELSRRGIFSANARERGWSAGSPEICGTPGGMS